MIALTDAEIARLFAKIQMGEDCWSWHGEVNGAGYPRLPIYRGGRRLRVLVHRVMHHLATGEDAPVVRHTCDNKGCVNPAHALGGTQADNIRDAIERGRLNTTGIDAWRAFARELPQQRVQADAKACSRCRKTKPLAAFRKNRSTADGRQYWCGDCQGGLTERQRRRITRDRRAQVAA